MQVHVRGQILAILFWRTGMSEHEAPIVAGSKKRSGANKFTSSAGGRY